MHIVAQTNDSVQVILSLAELQICNQALNEVANGIQIPDWEFPTRLGHDRAAVRALLNEVNRLLHRLDPDRSDQEHPTA